MVNTIVRFENNHAPSTRISFEKQTYYQEYIYLITGICLLIGLCLPNIFSIIKDHEDFAYDILFLFHASCLILFFISTAFFQNTGNVLATIISLILLGAYKMIHYLIRYRYCRMSFRRDFLFSTMQLIGLFVFMIVYMIWSYLLIRRRPKLNHISSDFKQKRIFYSFLALDVMLIISTLILNIHSPEHFGLYDILILSIGIPLALLWLAIGILMSIYSNCLCISLFYILSLIQPFHVVHMIFKSINDLNNLSGEFDRTNEFLSLFIIIFVCIGTNLIVHLLMNITACWMLTKTEKKIFNTGWMLTSIEKI